MLNHIKRAFDAVKRRIASYFESRSTRNRPVSEESTSSRNAARLAVAQKNLDAANRLLKDALDRHSKGLEQLAAAQNDNERVAANGVIRQASTDLDEAARNVELETLRIDDLSGTGGDRVQEDKRMATIQYLVFGLLAALVIVFLMYGIVSTTLLPSLAGIPTARGLITFLIAVVTVTIALILVLATVVSDSPERAQRFLQGKEVLTALIGVLGTIVGFYFGSSLDERAKRLDIAPIFISNENPTAGEKVGIVTFVSGGSPPYTYDITFNPNSIPGLKNVQTPNGLVSAEVSAPSVAAETEISFEIRVEDSEERIVKYDSKSAGKKLHVKPATTE